MDSNSHLINPKNWVITDLIFNNDRTFIYNVIPFFDKDTPEEYKKYVNECSWILKLTTDTDEINIIYAMEICNNNLCIKIDKNSLYYERKINRSWYVMEKYDNHISTDYYFTQNHIIELGKYVIDFFHWLHLEKKLAAQEDENKKLAARNRAIDADIKELKSGAQALEEQARFELGMVKEGEVYYQFVD